MSENTTLIDVRLQDDYNAEHITGAISCCVFEVSFLGTIREKFPDHSAPIRVYGASDESAEGKVAIKKLEHAGYSNLEEIPGGLAAWKTAGKETSKGKAIAPLPRPDGDFLIDLSESYIKWTGRNLLNSHHGTLGIKSGELVFKEGSLEGGKIIFDMNDITCTDLAGSDLHDVLIDHLKNDDFFDVGRFPQAELDIRSAKIRETPGTQNLTIEAALTLCGQTHPIAFDAVAGLTPEGKPAAQASFSFDRTKWGVIYGSGKFFSRLAGHLVNDHIELQIKILTK